MIDTAPPPALLIAFAAALGSVVGSFLNVCIYRLPIGKSIVWPASACTKCGHELAWYENVPIVSWSLLLGRCRVCRAPIAIRYPLIETLTGAMFALAWWYYGPGILLASRLVLGCMLIVLFAIDLEHQLLPNAITLPGTVVGMLSSVLVGPGWVDSLLGIVVGAGFFIAMFYLWLWLRNVEALGFGDVKMMAMVGAFLGWRLTVLTMMFGSVVGSIFGVYLIATKRGTMSSAVPYGCFLALGAAAAATVGQPLIEWYVGLWR